MTDEEKKLLQAKHRLEEAQMRDRPERAKSTDTAADSRRCDFGESITADNTDDFGTVGGFFMRSIQTNPMIFMSDRLSVAFSFSRRAHLLTTC